MKVGEYLDTEPVENPSGAFKRQVINHDTGAPHFVMNVFEIQPGTCAPAEPHIHWHEHEIFIISGQGVARCGDEEYPISAGNYVFIAPGDLHNMVNTGNEPLRFVCCMPIVTIQ